MRRETQKIQKASTMVSWYDCMLIIRKTNYYRFHVALIIIQYNRLCYICSQRRFDPEMVYLLGRIGNTSEALMTRELNDMESAIAFCQEHDDEELWNDLVNYSLDKPGMNQIMFLKVSGYYIPPSKNRNLC